MFFVHKFKNLQNCTIFFQKTPYPSQGDYERECGRLPVPIMDRYHEAQQAIHQVGGHCVHVQCTLGILQCWLGTLCTCVTSRPYTRCGFFWNSVHSSKRGSLCICEVFSRLSNRLSLLSRLRSRIRPQVSKGGLSTTWAES
jgi:hypothetical protein